MLTTQEETTVRRGLAASNLLANEDFRELIQSMMVESFAVFTETKPDEGAKREEHYHLCQALKQIEAELLARVQAKDALELRENLDDEDELSEDDQNI